MCTALWPCCHGTTGRHLRCTKGMRKCLQITLTLKMPLLALLRQYLRVSAS